MPLVTVALLIPLLRPVKKLPDLIFQRHPRSLHAAPRRLNAKRHARATQRFHHRPIGFAVVRAIGLSALIPMSTLTANVRKAAAEATLQFDWLLGDRQWWSFKAVEGITGLSDSFVEKLWDDAQHDLHISGHEYNGGKGLRNTKRVARAFVVQLLVKSARYDAEQKLHAYLSCLREFSAADLLTISREAQRLAASKPLQR